MKSDIGVAPLSMGGLTYGVNTRDMAEAFAVFPNGGLYHEVPHLHQGDPGGGRRGDRTAGKPA